LKVNERRIKMSFFDEAVSAAKTVGKTVGKKTEEILIISKKKLSAIELENKLSNYYENLGKIYFADLSGNDNEIIDNIIGQEELVINITETIADLKDIREEIAALSNKK